MFMTFLCDFEQKITILESQETFLKVKEFLEHEDHIESHSCFVNCQIDMLSHIEFRAFCLLTIAKVFIRFRDKQEAVISVEYQLHPS
jgi:hypothetical protein